MSAVLDKQKLNRFLSKVKFQSKLDLEVFEVYLNKKTAQNSVESKINTWRNLKKDKLTHSIMKFRYNSWIGNTLKKRIDNLRKRDKEVLRIHNSIEEYVDILLGNMQCSKRNRKLLLDYARDKITSS